MKRIGGMQVTYCEITMLQLKRMAADYGYIESAEKRRSGTYMATFHEKLLFDGIEIYTDYEKSLEYDSKFPNQ